MSDLNELKVTELKARLREAKLPTSGVKTTLVRRLMEHMQAQSVTQIVEEPPLDGKLEDLIKKIGLTGLKELFQREKITLDILSEMDHSAMKDLGILAYGDRHRLIKELKLHNQPQPQSESVIQTNLGTQGVERELIDFHTPDENLQQSTSNRQCERSLTTPETPVVRTDTDIPPESREGLQPLAGTSHGLGSDIDTGRLPIMTSPQTTTVTPLDLNTGQHQFASLSDNTEPQSYPTESSDSHIHTQVSISQLSTSQNNSGISAQQNLNSSQVQDVVAISQHPLNLMTAQLQGVTGSTQTDTLQTHPEDSHLHSFAHLPQGQASHNDGRLVQTQVSMSQGPTLQSNSGLLVQQGLVTSQPQDVEAISGFPSDQTTTQLQGSTRASQTATRQMLPETCDLEASTRLSHGQNLHNYTDVLQTQVGKAQTLRSPNNTDDLVQQRLVAS